LKARIAHLNLVDETRQAWRNARAAKDAKMEETSDLVLAIKQLVLVTYGPKADILADFGLVPRQRKASTVATKYDAKKKAEATRAARKPSAALTPTPTHSPTPTPTSPPPPKPTTNGATTPNGSPATPS
jgi:hypothetical protein